MYSICKSTHPATGVEHAITCHFFNRAEKCLVVAGANVIRVFRLIPDIDVTKKEKYTGELFSLILILDSVLSKDFIKINIGYIRNFILI